ncbi:MAG TPA: hypothetical protein VGP16_04840 [Asanoa sp.]|nr:hypothetical protein [Asanoa sp.]
MAPAPWHTAPIVAFDLEGSGAQDRDREAILELAAVPLVNGRPAPDRGFTTLVNPGRPIRDGSRSLSDLIQHFGLSATVDAAAPGSQPHRALWDATAVGYLLPSLTAALWPDEVPALGTIRGTAPAPSRRSAEQPRLF